MLDSFFTFQKGGFVMDSWGKYKTKCPNCGGKVEWWNFDSDCRGNFASSGINCIGVCKREFTYNEWEIIAKKELKEKALRAKKEYKEARIKAIIACNKSLEKELKSKKNKK